MEMLVVLGW